MASNNQLNSQCIISAKQVTTAAAVVVVVVVVVVGKRCTFIVATAK
jgi:hypothetical protein